ncbi:MAG: hypothetical protein IPP49_02220 [Saprospiraceae bacterium]|nr:hypothetical protein [Saprospiraceae bacterium]
MLNTISVCFLLFFFSPADIIYSVDSDTLMAGGLVRMIKGQSQIYDAHEYFTEVPELYQRTFVQKFWISLENIFVPRADAFITVNESLANLFQADFKRSFIVFTMYPYIKITLRKIPQSHHLSSTREC